MSNAHASALPRARGRLRPEDRRRGNKLAWLIEHRAQLLASIAVLSLVVGGLLYAVGEGAAGQMVWRVTVALLAAELGVEVGRTVVVEHSLGVDTIALVAMVGALALDQELAGVVIGLMFSGGASLEAIASRRARRELSALVQRAPKVAHVRVDDRLQEVPIERVQAGDVAVVRTGEVVPVDGTVLSAEAVVDTSTLTGEPLPETVRRGMPVLSGSANAGPPFDVRADRPAADSAYAALVRLVEQAQTQRAPFVRMADRYAGFFLPATVLVAGLAWALSGDPVHAVSRLVAQRLSALHRRRTGRGGIIVADARADDPGPACVRRAGGRVFPGAGRLRVLPQVRRAALPGGDEQHAFVIMPILNYLLSSVGFCMMLFWATVQGMFHDWSSRSTRSWNRSGCWRRWRTSIIRFCVSDRGRPSCPRALRRSRAARCRERNP